MNFLPCKVLNTQCSLSVESTSLRWLQLMLNLINAPNMYILQLYTLKPWWSHGFLNWLKPMARCDVQLHSFRRKSSRQCRRLNRTCMSFKLGKRGEKQIVLQPHVNSYHFLRTVGTSPARPPVCVCVSVSVCVCLCVCVCVCVCERESPFFFFF